MRIAATLALVAAGAALCACTSTSTDIGTPMSQANATSENHVRELIDEMRYMHGTELYGRMNSLARMGDSAVPALREGAKSDDWLVRSSSIWVLGATGDRRNIPAIHAALSDENETVRCQAASALVQLGDPRGFAVLVDGLADEQVEMRFRCFKALKLTTGLDFGYRHDGVADDRRVAVYRWREWLEGVKTSAL